MLFEGKFNTLLNELIWKGRVSSVKKQEPIRVLHVVGRMDRGGIETLIMNLYRNIDRSKVQFDFLAHYGREAVYNEEIRSMGGVIYEMPALKDDTHVYYWRLFQYIKALREFFKSHDYKIIHGHMTNTASIYMPIAKEFGVSTRIAHSHNTHGKAGLLGFVTNVLQKPIYTNATDWFACSKAAAYWFYPKDQVDSGKVTIVPNAVDAQRFRFSNDIRSRMRSDLGIENNLVIGCVARFRPEKNHSFLLKVLLETLRIEPSAVLLFAGEGPCEDSVKTEVEKLGLRGKVIFLGMRTDVPDLLQAMDVFVLASLWEGLPVTGIEAQASGLHCVVSDGITEEMNALDMVDYVSLDAPLREWAEKIVKSAGYPRKDTFEEMKRAGYDIHTTASWLQEFYLRKARES